MATEKPGGLWSRLGWFVVLWVGGVAVVGVVAFGLRKVLLG